ncbi:hypothetical protein F5Y18DRAFT_429177 [Xylariaceae sp. FL1019]|nr:hypothetical protein F5Y18DRAFT_429177 [Xylariaceae sp. FL1019]
MMLPWARKCKCKCRGTGRCKGGNITKADPNHSLCEICYYEVTHMNSFRKSPTCQYPDPIIDRIFKPNRKTPSLASTENKASAQEPNNAVVDSSSSKSQLDHRPDSITEQFSNMCIMHKTFNCGHDRLVFPLLCDQHCSRVVYMHEDWCPRCRIQFGEMQLAAKLANAQHRSG